MELASPPQEIPRCQTSSLCPNYAAIGAVSLPAQAVFGRVALASSCLFQLFPGRCRGGCVKSGPETRGEAVVFSSLFQLRLSLFRLTLPRACPAPFSVEPVVVQRLNLVFGRSKSSRKR